MDWSAWPLQTHACHTETQCSPIAPQAMPLCMMYDEIGRYVVSCTRRPRFSPTACFRTVITTRRPQSRVMVITTACRRHGRAKGCTLHFENACQATVQIPHPLKRRGGGVRGRPVTGWIRGAATSALSARTRGLFVHSSWKQVRRSGWGKTSCHSARSARGLVIRMGSWGCRRG